MSWTILIVDDSHAARTQLRAPLEAKGVTVIEAENGREGLWRARQTTVDLVVVDIHMPLMDGITMIRELRQLPGYETTPIFVLTADATSARIEEGRKAGANAWMLKPAQPELLWKSIEKVLFRKPASTARPQDTVAGDKAGER
jgi:two-component system, chemotaxis family, chemotaxis protein CheY